ncbi:translation initiation factor 2 [Streptomyces scopuliridis]|uniref:translation initiation factor 2 n=1 Tax=Streptomyces scopuliridis TaxID=452529 RepID=UPI0036CBAFF3
MLPVFAGDDRIRRLFTLVPGSDFDVDALAAIERVHARTIPWDEACRRSFDLILAASPKGDLGLLRGDRVLLPHGAGFNKTIRGEGSGDSASGLDPAYVLPGGRPVSTLYALAHPSQVARLAAVSPSAARQSAVVGDPTLERLLASRSHRDQYRAALGTGGRELIVLTSTWGPESLLARRPALPAELAVRLPHDRYQLALIVHPNERSRTGVLDLAERLAPALDAGLVLAGPYEEWAAVLVAADAVVTDHGSTALYAAALDRTVIAAYDGGDELIPGSPMAELLAHSVRLERSDRPESSLEAAIETALDAHRPGVTRAFADAAFAERGHALERLREEVYGLLGLDPLADPATARVLPPPAPSARVPAAFAVRVHIGGAEVRVERYPAHSDAPAHHLAAEHGTASERHAQSAGLLYRRAERSTASPQRSIASPHREVRTAAGWTAGILDSYPGCRTAAVVLSPSLCVLRTRSGALLTVRVSPCRETDRIVEADPAAVLSAVHAWLGARPGQSVAATADAITCRTGQWRFPVRLSPATPDEAELTL